MSDITILNLSKANYTKHLSNKALKLTGQVTLNVLAEMKKYEYDYLDLSEAQFGIDQEAWEVCLGWSHHGPVYGRSGYRDVEVLRRFLEIINAKTILLPDDVMRRHINSALYNQHIKELRVNDTCKLFSYEDGILMNKKKTSVVFAKV